MVLNHSMHELDLAYNCEKKDSLTKAEEMHTECKFIGSGDFNTTLHRKSTVQNANDSVTHRLFCREHGNTYFLQYHIDDE